MDVDHGVVSTGQNGGVLAQLKFYELMQSALYWGLEIQSKRSGGRNQIVGTYWCVIQLRQLNQFAFLYKD